MKRIFFTLLAVLLLVNFTYKTVIYLSYTKVTGKVVKIQGSSINTTSTDKYGRKRVITRYIKTPVVEFKYQGVLWQVTRAKWGTDDVVFFKENDSAEVLIDSTVEHVELNSFFTFWTTFNEMFWAVMVLIFGSVILGIAIPETAFSKKPTVWK